MLSETVMAFLTKEHTVARHAKDLRDEYHHVRTKVCRP